MQEFIYETVGKDEEEWEGLSDGEVVDGLVDYLDAILGKYEGSTPPPPKDIA
jgi:molybdopterin converting factor small subunit